jgi:hypothetical protein
MKLIETRLIEIILKIIIMCFGLKGKLKAQYLNDSKNQFTYHDTFARNIFFNQYAFVSERLILPGFACTLRD